MNLFHGLSINIHLMIQIHMKTFNSEEPPEITDFTYAYLSEMNRRKKAGEPNEYFRYQIQYSN